MSATTPLICPRCKHRFDIERIPAEWAACPNCGFHETEWIRPQVVSTNRQGWRARLANVERLLTQVFEHSVGGVLQERDLREALAEVRSMIDGDEGS